MVSMVVSGNAALPILFNVDSAVGKGCPNLPDDVDLVTLLFKRLAYTAGATAEGKRLAGSLTVGVADQALTDTINFFESRLLGAKITSSGADSRVSPARGLRHSRGFFVIVELNGAIAELHSDVWPRIDRIPGCSARLAGRVRKLLLPS